MKVMTCKQHEVINREFTKQFISAVMYLALIKDVRIPARKYVN